MILPIMAYGNPILRKVSTDITIEYPDLPELIENMQQTMKNAQGVGLAAPQIGKNIRLFVIDGSSFAENGDLDNKERVFLKNFKKTFINAKIINESGEDQNFKEGCLSIPDIRENVARKPTIEVSYLDENFVEHRELFTGLAARIFQHEYDHIEGILFTDRLSALKKRLLKKKLKNISKGKTEANYTMYFHTHRKIS